MMTNSETEPTILALSLSGSLSVEFSHPLDQSSNRRLHPASRGVEIDTSTEDDWIGVSTSICLALKF